MASTVLSVDGYDLSALDFQVETITGWRDGIAATWPSQPVPGRFGVQVTGSEPIYAPRQVVVSGAIVSADVATLVAYLDELKWRVGRTQKTFTIVDNTAREFNARVTQFVSTAIAPAIIQVGVRVAITLWMDDPRTFATSDTVVSSIGSATDLPLGSAPSLASIVITGSGAFTMTYKDYSGATISTLSISGATAPVTIDMDALTITDAGGNAADTLGTGSDFPITFDPEHGDDIFGTPNWPTLELTSGSGTATYRKAYL
jgi:phage-related protein